MKKLEFANGNQILLEFAQEYVYLGQLLTKEPTHMKNVR